MDELSIRNDEQIKALRDELRSGFDRLEAAITSHVAEDRAAHKKIDHLATEIDVRSMSSRRMWGAVTVIAAVVGASAQFVYNVVATAAGLH